MKNIQKGYIPAAGHDWVLPFYDPMMKLLGGEKVRRTLLDQAAIQPGQCVLDIGCGTGSLVVLIKRLNPEVRVIALDPDPKALARARRKAKHASVSIKFDQGFSHELPYPEASIDRVFSSFMLHHIPSDKREKTLKEVRRVLSPDGFFYLLDFDGPESRGVSSLGRMIHSSQHLKENSEHRILALMTQAGFADPKKIDEGAMLFGQVRTKSYAASVTK
ncbi:MAG TPA: class I SAM-dependent methyltransferase [Candidatus Binatia bacterium]|nr:class I SAM-dependent methyltransferase [Candidatus Binatia bacterium]